MKNLILALTLLVTGQAYGAVVHACDSENQSLNRIDMLVGNLKSFANGDIRVAYVSTEEPAASPDHILVFVTDQETGMFQECFAVSNNEEFGGFSSVWFDELKAKYEDGKGLLLTVPVGRYQADGQQPAKSLVKIRVNRAGGKNKVWLE